MASSAGIKQFQHFNKRKLVRKQITDVKTRKTVRTLKLRKKEETKNHLVKRKQADPWAAETKKDVLQEIPTQTTEK